MGARSRPASPASVSTPAEGKTAAKAADGRPSSTARKDLMAIAIDCFARYGYQGTSIDRIASAAGVTKGAIYYHCSSRQ